MTKAGIAIGAVLCIVALFIALLILPATLPAAGSLRLGLRFSGEYMSMVVAAVAAAAPLGLAFGVIPARNVAMKSVVVSVCAAVLMVAFTVAFAGLRPGAWKPFVLEGAVFIAVFSCCAVAGHRLTSRFSRRLTAALGVVAFVALFALVVVGPFVAAVPGGSMTNEARLERAMGELRDARTDTDRFYALRDAAKLSLDAGDFDAARSYATELLQLAPQFEKDWNYGNAIHDGNMVLGRLAVREGRIDAAKQFLLQAGATPGSPQLNSFGPNVSLAKELLETGEREVVLQYFELIGKFWELEKGRLNSWADEIRAGRMPAFGANLFY